jgi:hypothetical protein
MDMCTSKTITRIGEKTITVKTFSNEKIRISVLLGILAKGSKLPPVIIFKGKKGKNKENKLKNNINVLNNKAFVYCQPKAWVDTEIFSKLVN